MSVNPNEPTATIGTVEYPKHPGVSDELHYRILQHAMGMDDLAASADGIEAIRAYKAAADACPTHGGNKPAVRIPEPGELPPSHLTDDERAAWLERQRTQALLPGEEG